jgi:hypothetical protein
MLRAWWWREHLSNETYPLLRKIELEQRVVERALEPQELLLGYCLLGD